MLFETSSADVMHDMGAELIFAIDVGSHDDTNLTNYGDWLSGGKLFYRRYIARDPMRVKISGFCHNELIFFMFFLLIFAHRSQILIHFYLLELPFLCSN